jgi:benzodiazapine receptor
MAHRTDEGASMRLSPIVVFVLTYAAFLVSGFLFRIDRVWYDALVKPSWTPPGAVIGLIWSVLFGCIALSVAILDAKVGLLNLGPWLIAAIVANWVLNQAFSYFQATRQDWFLAGWDAALIAATAFIVAVLAGRVSAWSGWLYVPYAAWSSFATYLSFLIWSLNR